MRCGELTWAVIGVRIVRFWSVLLSLDHGLPDEGFIWTQPNVLGKIRPATGKILGILKWEQTKESLFIMT